MTAPTIDDRYWPLLVTIVHERLDDLDLPDFFARHERYLARGERYLTLTDTSLTRSVPDAKTRRLIGDWNQRMDPAMRQLTIGTAVVVSSTLVRGTLTALQWLAPPPYPTEHVATRLEGVDALIRICEKARERVPEPLVRYRRDLVSGSVALPG